MKDVYVVHVLTFSVHALELPTDGRWLRTNGNKETYFVSIRASKTRVGVRLYIFTNESGILADPGVSPDFAGTGPQLPESGYIRIYNVEFKKALRDGEWEFVSTPCSFMRATSEQEPVVADTQVPTFYEGWGEPTSPSRPRDTVSFVASPAPPPVALHVHRPKVPDPKPSPKFTGEVVPPAKEKKLRAPTHQPELDDEAPIMFPEDDDMTLVHDAIELHAKRPKTTKKVKRLPWVDGWSGVARQGTRVHSADHGFGAVTGGGPKMLSIDWDNKEGFPPMKVMVGKITLAGEGE